MKTLRRAFTLVELLTVIAISAILLTLIVVPVFQSFALTRQAQTLSDAQDKGRVLTERIGREVARAVAVRGSNRVIANVNGIDVTVPGTSLVVRVPQVDANGGLLNPRTDVEVLVPYAKMDLVQASEGGQIGPNGGFIDPVTGKEDPTLRNAKGQVVLPVAPGSTIVRWWIGLRDPFSLYNNPYDGLLLARNGSRDNLYVLYRAEVEPRVFNAGAYVGNDQFFELDAGGNPVLDDPEFFMPNVDAGGNPITNDAKADRIRNWLSRGVVQTEVSRYDMIQALYDKGSRRVLNVGGIPQLLPLIQFRPTRVDNEPAEGSVAVRLGEETDNAAAIAPDTFTTRMGLWSNAVVRTWPQAWLGTDSSRNEYLVGRIDANSGLPGFAPGFSIYAFDPDLSLDDFNTGTEVFDLDTYDRARAGAGRYPFSQAVRAADTRTGWLSNPQLRALFTPYWFDTAKGKIVASFGLDEVGDPNIAPLPASPENLPLVPTTRDGNAYTPQNDPVLGGNFYDANFANVNSRFNKVFDLWRNDAANTYGIRNIDPSRIHRFIDLRVTPQADGTPSPLAPQFGFKAAIVPGSEIVFGPDQIPGPNYGNPIRYVRVNGEPGPNQYRINYTNLKEPNDYTLLGLSGTALSGFDPNVYDAQQFTSAVIQPQYRAGYLQLNSNPNQPIPNGNIQVAYRFQFTGARTGSALASGGLRSDAFAVDYDSRELMSILLTIRAYPQSNAPNPQNVTLKASAKVRNYIR